LRAQVLAPPAAALHLDQVDQRRDFAFQTKNLWTDTVLRKRVIDALPNFAAQAAPCRLTTGGRFRGADVKRGIQSFGCGGSSK
jgi:hypothetical protein